MTGRHKDTLRQIFAHPLSHNVEWHDVVSLLREVTTVGDRHDGSVEVTAAGSTLVLRRPQHKDLNPDELMELRHVLEALGYKEEPT